MRDFASKHPVWTVIILLAVAVFIWLIFAVWPKGLVDVIGRKKVFLNAVFNGITLGGLYFLVASGFTLIFGLMRNVNLAHGSLYLLGGYIGYFVASSTGYWLLAFPVAFVLVAIVGILMQIFIFRRMEGQDLRQTLVTIGISIVMADLMLWGFGGDFYNISPPSWLSGPMETLFVTGVKRSSGELIYLKYPVVRVVIFLASVVIGVAMWLILNRTQIGMMIRAGVDDRDMLSATGARIQLVFVGVFAFGAGLAGIAGVVGGTFQSVAPGEDIRFPPGLPRGRHCRWYGVHHRCGARCPSDRPRGTVRFRLFPDLCGRPHIPDHGSGAGFPSSGPDGKVVIHGAG